MLEQGADDLRHDVFDCSIMKWHDIRSLHATRRRRTLQLTIVLKYLGGGGDLRHDTARGGGARATREPQSADVVTDELPFTSFQFTSR